MAAILHVAHRLTGTKKWRAKYRRERPGLAYYTTCLRSLYYR